MKRPTKKECEMAANPDCLVADLLPADVQELFVRHIHNLQYLDNGVWFKHLYGCGLSRRGVYRINPDAAEEESMKKPTKEECRVAANEDQKSFQCLGTYQRSLLEKYGESTQILGYDGRWLLRGGQQADMFNPGAIYRLNPAAAEPEGPSDWELELCKNPLMRALAAMPECTETLKKWPKYVQSINTMGVWHYTLSGIFPFGVYRLVKEPYDANY